MNFLLYSPSFFSTLLVLIPAVTHNYLKRQIETSSASHQLGNYNMYILYTTSDWLNRIALMSAMAISLVSSVSFYETTNNYTWPAIILITLTLIFMPTFFWMNSHELGEFTSTLFRRVRVTHVALPRFTIVVVNIIVVATIYRVGYSNSPTSTSGFGGATSFIVLYLAMFSLFAVSFIYVYHKFREVGDQVREEFKSTLAAETSRFRDFSPALTQEIPNLVLRELKLLIAREINEYGEGLKVAASTPTGKVLTDQTNYDKRMMREISHALNTPLSQIEAAIISIKSNIHLDGQDGSEEFAIIQSMQSSINICKSVLAAYRELVLVTGPSAASIYWSPISLADALSAAAAVYVGNSQKKLHVDINVPTDIDGYSNNFIVALLLPIIENAVDASTPDSKIIIKGEEGGGAYVIEVVNKTDAPPNTQEIYKDGFTTKAGHQGSGLSIVQSLLSIHKGASVNHYYDNDMVSFKITLPKGR